MKIPPGWQPPEGSRETKVNPAALGLPADPSAPTSHLRGSQEPEPSGPAKRKYGNEPVEADGHRFDSKIEYSRYRVLVILERAGYLTDLELHPAYPLIVNGRKIGRFTADFRYRCNGQLVIEDVKSEPTRQSTAYRLRKRLFEAIYGLKLTEVLSPGQALPVKAPIRPLGGRSPTG